MLSFSAHVQARADGGDEMDDLLSAPRMVLSQFVDKWFPDADSETTAYPTSRLQKLLLDVSSVLATRALTHASRIVYEHQCTVTPWH
jgi:hypothetical protein